MAVAISMAVMIIAIAVAGGYQKEIRNKITGFHAHVQLVKLDMNNSFERMPIAIDTSLELKLQKASIVQSFRRFTLKPAIIKTDSLFQGILLKGMDKTADYSYLKSLLVSGKMPQFNSVQSSKEIVISHNTADALHKKVNDKLTLYFIQDPPRVRQFQISGIYESGLDEMDALYSFIDSRQIQRLNAWNSNLINGYEVSTASFDKLPELEKYLNENCPINLDVRSVTHMYPALFDWLKLLDTNVYIIISLMLLVACINMVTALLILIIERSKMIATLQVMGMSRQKIRWLFSWLGSSVLINGLIWGNVLGFIAIFLQYKFAWIHLSQKDYFISKVPISFEWLAFLILNIATIFICFLVLMLPANYVSKIKPASVIRWD